MLQNRIGLVSGKYTMRWRAQTGGSHARSARRWMVTQPSASNSVPIPVRSTSSSAASARCAMGVEGDAISRTQLVLSNATPRFDRVQQCPVPDIRRAAACAAPTLIAAGHGDGSGNAIDDGTLARAEEPGRSVRAGPSRGVVRQMQELLPNLLCPNAK